MKIIFIFLTSYYLTYSRDRQGAELFNARRTYVFSKMAALERMKNELETISATLRKKHSKLSNQYLSYIGPLDCDKSKIISLTELFEIWNKKLEVSVYYSTTKENLQRVKQQLEKFAHEYDEMDSSDEVETINESMSIAV